MPRIRLAFRQDGPARFLGHLDVMRTFERACRRAGLRPAYTQGFNPHPKMGFAAPLPVGMNGAREYVDLELESEAPAADVAAALARQLPAGLTVLGARPVEAGGSPLMGQLGRAHYRVTGRAANGEKWDDERLRAAVERFLGRAEVFVTRRTGKGTKKKDIRPGIRSLRARTDGETLILTMELAAGGGGTVRPDEVLRALREEAGLDLVGAEVWRTALLSGDGRLLWEC
ncbi:MAG: TIGR03936 family radical SAM-associated protein [Thermoanaerobacterales bacterium]|nr:TIGR03936 family radical SAM-associated protein [Thermoanaerobacterales bacterium]